MSEEIGYLIEGHKKFRQQYFERDNELYKNLVETGQQPRYLVIACSDSRVDPAIILDCKPGDLFVIRNVANLIPPCEIDTHYHGTSAALEFGIRGLGIKHIIILGHSQCGGIAASLENCKNEQDFQINNFLSKWVEIAKPACHEVISEHPELSTAEQIDICARNSILYSVENLNSFSWIRERISLGTLFVHGWYFDLKIGKIYFYNPLEPGFEILDSHPTLKRSE